MKILVGNLETSANGFHDAPSAPVASGARNQLSHIAFKRVLLVARNVKVVMVVI